MRPAQQSTPISPAIGCRLSGSTLQAEHIAGIVRTRLAERGAGALAQPVALVQAEGLPAGAYRIAGTPDGLEVAGGDGAALLAGVGRLLREGSIATGRFIPGSWRGLAQPACGFRTAYLATHYRNWYEEAPIEEVCSYIEELGLWGYNSLLIHFPTWQFTGLAAAGARVWLDRARMMFARARACGLRVGLVVVPNQGFQGTRSEWLGVKVVGHRRGNWGINLCPSQPEAAAALIALNRDLMAEFQDVGCDELVLWPYDEGGCHCAQCMPWGGKGYLAIGKAVAAAARERFPALRVTVSTWYFANEQDADPEGEWPAFEAALTRDHTWVDRLMADGYGGYFPRRLLEAAAPAGLPLVSFPEISMFQGGPWGGRGANPGPADFHRQWLRLSGRISGGMVYSEGIFDDINKVLWAGWWWDAKADPVELLRAYAAWEFGAAVADDVVEAIGLIGAAGESPAGTPRPDGLLDGAEARLDARARASWRWRILRLRGVIEAELHRRGGESAGPVLREAYAELTRIYHAEHAHVALMPPKIP